MEEVIGSLNVLKGAEIEKEKPVVELYEKGKGKSKVHPITGHEGPEEE